MTIWSMLLSTPGCYLFLWSAYRSEIGFGSVMHRFWIGSYSHLTIIVHSYICHNTTIYLYRYMAFILIVYRYKIKIASEAKPMQNHFKTNHRIIPDRNPYIKHYIFDQLLMHIHKKWYSNHSLPDLKLPGGSTYVLFNFKYKDSWCLVCYLHIQIILQI